MKKIILTLIVLVIGFVWWNQSHKCVLESQKVHKVVWPIIKAFSDHIDQYGFPKTLDDVQGINYTLITCQGNKKIKGCYGYENRRYIEIEEDTYSFSGYPYGKSQYLFSVVHNNTLCDYYFSLDKDKKGLDPMKNYSLPRCRLLCGITWWRM
jgi:hypothetical protein